ncbi:hypothetical protein CSOJ01_08069 [Colletotrichum sojae]|uniref:Transmembrane protein n=1 Tax=Colletotrichum sojae TaxID=2175907 RepID=A0A8H6J7A3_9PEZI|nr:hypothetical protein CSOJ01_08069 [Colletotrichum sojae]
MMRDHPSSPRQGSPAPPQAAPRTLSDELGDFMSSSDDYDDDYESHHADEEEEEEEDMETPMSSRKSSQSEGYFDQNDNTDFDQTEESDATENEAERGDLFNPRPFPDFAMVRKFPRFEDEDACESRPATATSQNLRAPPFRRSSTCPVITPDFLSSAAEEVVRIMPGQAEYMKRMVAGWREIQRRSSVGAIQQVASEHSATAGRGERARPRTAPSVHPPVVNFASFPRTVPERVEEDVEELPPMQEEEEPPREVSRSSTPSERSEPETEEREAEKVETTLDELRAFAKQRASAATLTSPQEQSEKFAVAERCIDAIGRVYDRKRRERGRRRKRLGVKCVAALVRICEMFASEGADGGAYRFEPVLEGFESDADDEDEEEEKRFPRPSPITRAWCEEQSDLTAVGSGDYFFAEGGEKMRVPASPTKDPYDDRRHAALVEQAKAELATLLAEAEAERKTPFEERHSRVVYAVEAYLARLSEMEASHDAEFRWHDEMKAFHAAMGSSRRVLASSEPGAAMALVASLSFCFIPIATVLWYVTEPTTTWMLWRIFIPIGCYFLLLAGFYVDQKTAHDALYEEMVPKEAREMRKRHRRERELLQGAHEKALQRLHSAE